MFTVVFLRVSPNSCDTYNLPFGQAVNKREEKISSFRSGAVGDILTEPDFALLPIGLN